MDSSLSSRTSDAMATVAPLTILLGFSAACYLLLAFQLSSKKEEVGHISISISFAVIGLWVLGGAIGIAAGSYAIFSFGRLGHFVGIAILPVSLLLYFRQYTGRDISRVMVVALMIVPVFTIIVAATNQIHEFMWSSPAVNVAGEFLVRPIAWGPWYVFVQAPFGYTVVGLGVLTLVMHSNAVAPANRRRLFVLAGATTVPIVALLAYDLGYGPNTVSVLPILFTAMLPIYAWIFLGERLAMFSPLAYETVFQNMQDPVVVVDEAERIIGLNRSAEAMLKLKETDVLCASFESVFGADVPVVHQVLKTGVPQRMMTKTGRFLHVQVSSLKGNSESSRSGRVLMFRDVSDVEKSVREARNSDLMLRALVDHSVNGIVRLRWVTDDDGSNTLRCIFANSAAGKFLLADPQDMIDRSADDLVRLASSGMDDRAAENVREQFRFATEHGEIIDTEVRVGQKGTGKWMRVIGESVGDDVAITFIDITDKKVKEIQMESIAWSDPLTSVLNRRGFEQNATERLSDSEDDATGALLFMDLNDFKLINDDYGHQVGDQLLIIAAERIRTRLRSCDIIGRLGGDEFVALVPDADEATADKLASRLSKSLGSTYIIGAEVLSCPASIGLALYPVHASTLTGLLRVADQAMYRAKARCRMAANVDYIDLLEKAM